MRIITRVYLLIFILTSTSVFSKKLKEALKTFEIALLDHLIIGDQKYYSFADDGIL